MDKKVFGGLLTLLLLAIGSLCLSSCGDDDEPNGKDNEDDTTEQVFTGIATDVTANSATISCNYTSKTNASYLQLGVIFSTERAVVDNKQGVLSLSNNISGSTYVVELSNLSSNTIYYYRAIMISGGNTYYGSVNSLKTSQGELVNTGTVTDLTYKSATISSSFQNNNILSYESLGVKYSTSRATLESGQGQSVSTSEVTGGSTFTVKLTNLTEQTTYYYRSFVKTYNTLYLGVIKDFTTPKNQVDYNGHAYVDLGLPSGTKWATMNIGASSPEGFGEYYAWGETTPKYSFTPDNYQWKGLSADELADRGVVSKTFQSGTTTYNYFLTANYDVATLKWGSVWRMPTHHEISELENHTIITASTLNSINGFLFTSIHNGKTIFLPATGIWDETGLQFGRDTGNDPWYRGTCWSSELNPYYDTYSIALWIDNGSTYGMKNIAYTGAQRYYGSQIRPVTSY